MDTGEEERKRVVVESSDYGLELGGGEGVSVAVGELVEACEYSLFQVSRGVLGSERGSSGVGHFRWS